MFKKKLLATALGSALLSAGTGAVWGQAGGSGLVLEEVVVTAQRRGENIQDVPLTVTAITAQQVQEYALFRFDDIEKLSPGLKMDSQGAFGSRVQLRGVGFDSNASSAPAVDIYINETPVDANYAFQSMYDIGQVEVLRGPQGILRGRPSPGGAITLTTRRPDLDGFGGQVSGSAGDEDTLNGQAAVNVPLIEGQLALRLAGVHDEDSGARVKSITSGKEDERETDSWRASLRWAPTDFIDATLTHQDLESDRTNMVGVNGPGAGYNGPAINGPGVSVMEDSTNGTQNSEITTLNLEWDLGRHRVVYSGAYQDNSFDYLAELDANNAVSNFLEQQETHSKFEVDSHELRLESTAPDASFEYMLGAWYSKIKTETTFAQPSPLPGAFGNPLDPSHVGPPDSGYVMDVSGYIPTDDENKAIYGSLTFHLTDLTDLSLGARYLENESDRGENLYFSEPLIAIGIAPGVPLGGVCDGLIGLGVGFNGEEPWPGYCQLELALPDYDSPASGKSDEWVYQASLKHQFTDELMAYFTYSHSYRPAGVTVGVTAPVDPSLIQGDDEQSDSYELGMKSVWMDGRLRLNAAIFHQDFENFIGRFNDIPFLNSGTGQIETATGFTYPGDAVVDGMDVDVAFDVTDNWWVQLTTAYADGHFDDASVPCRDTNGDGQPDDGDVGNLTPGDFGDNDVIFCQVDSPISTVPEWVTTAQSEFTFPVMGHEGYLRGLYNYYSEENNDGGFEANAYGLLNLYLGLRDRDGVWEVSLWAKNALDEEELLDLDDPQTVYGAFQSGYGEAIYTTGREIGLTVRYLFGAG